MSLFVVALAACQHPRATSPIPLPPDDELLQVVVPVPSWVGGLNIVTLPAFARSSDGSSVPVSHQVLASPLQVSCGRAGSLWEVSTWRVAEGPPPGTVLRCDAGGQWIEVRFWWPELGAEGAGPLAALLASEGWPPAAADPTAVRTVQAPLRGDLGLGVVRLNRELVVSWLDPDGPAAHAGMRVEDRLLTVDGLPTGTVGVEPLRDHLRADPTAPVALRLARGDQHLELRIERPPDWPVCFGTPAPRSFYPHPEAGDGPQRVRCPSAPDLGG